MALLRPVHGAPLPQVDQESGIQDKLDLYRTLFAGRSDVYAYRWENAADGTKGWSPRRRPGTVTSALLAWLFSPPVSVMVQGRC